MIEICSCNSHVHVDIHVYIDTKCIYVHVHIIENAEIVVTSSNKKDVSGSVSFSPASRLFKIN